MAPENRSQLTATVTVSLDRRAKCGPCGIAILVNIVLAVFAGVLLCAFLAPVPDPLPRFKVDNISMSPLNLSMSENIKIPAKWSVEITAKSKLDSMTLYEDFEVFIYFSSRNQILQLLSNATVPDFYQQPKEETKLTVESKAALDYPVARFISDDLKRNNGTTAGFDLKLKFILNTGSLFLFEAVCRDLKIGSVSSAALSSQPCSSILIK